MKIITGDKKNYLALSYMELITDLLIQSTINRAKKNTYDSISFPSKTIKNGHISTPLIYTECIYSSAYHYVFLTHPIHNFHSRHQEFSAKRKYATSIRELQCRQENRFLLPFQSVFSYVNTEHSDQHSVILEHALSCDIPA